MVNMNLGRKARYTSSIANSTKIYGTMGGLASVVGLDSATRSLQQRRASTTSRIPTNPVAGLNFMRMNNLLSVNPLGSGGVGRKTLIFK